MARVAVGGTFDPLHDGHKALLRKAIELGRSGELFVGLTSDNMVENKNHNVVEYRSRRQEVDQFIRSQGIEPVIVKLDDAYGPTTHEHFDAIVVSPETHPVALKINHLRREHGLQEIQIVLVDFVLAEDGFPITSTRIKRGEIDKHGKILKNG